MVRLGLRANRIRGVIAINSPADFLVIWTCQTSDVNNGAMIEHVYFYRVHGLSRR